MLREEKLDLYLKAKEGYYNGNPIMEDFEFDKLEEELGLENKSFIGNGSTPNYTIKHPYIMGSLSKVQIKADKLGNINWFEYADSVNNYLKHSNFYNGLIPCIITPKYDGCSFEYHYNRGNIEISSRGDGNYGRDIKKHLEKKCQEFNYYIDDDEFTLRGEVLIKKSLFSRKYNNFTNPRSFVSGILNRKYEDIKDKSVLDDLSLIIYDYRRVNEEGEWEDIDWFALQGAIVQDKLPKKFYIKEFEGIETLKLVYKDFEEYRAKCEYALDGIVIKPIFEYRKLNLTKERPEDCVAIKFLPSIKETTITNIEWQLGKTGEYTPIINFETIILGGKKVNKASGHNYGYVVEKGLREGVKIKISLAGDIIPFIYDVQTNLYCGLEYEHKLDAYVESCHLMKNLNPVEQMEINFLASCKSLNITGLGDKQAKKIFDSLEYKVEHVFYVSELNIRRALERGDGKEAQNIINALQECKEKKTLSDVIVSMNLKDCGIKTAEQCAKYLIDPKLSDFSGLSSIGYDWLKDEHTIEKLKSLLRHKDDTTYGHEFDRYVELYILDNEEKIKVILTGSPSHYATKKDFLNQHPEFEETSKWKECQTLFTGDLNSTSSKMEKAKNLGIEIKEY